MTVQQFLITTPFYRCRPYLEREMALHENIEYFKEMHNNMWKIKAEPNEHESLVVIPYMAETYEYDKGFNGIETNNDVYLYAPLDNYAHYSLVGVKIEKILGLTMHPGTLRHMDHGQVLAEILLEVGWCDLHLPKIGQDEEKDNDENDTTICHSGGLMYAPSSIEVENMQLAKDSGLSDHLAWLNHQTEILYRVINPHWKGV